MLSAGVQITSVCPQRATEHPHTTPALFVVRPQADHPRYYIPRRFKRRTAYPPDHIPNPKRAPLPPKRAPSYPLSYQSQQRPLPQQGRKARMQHAVRRACSTTQAISPPVQLHSCAYRRVCAKGRTHVRACIISPTASPPMCARHRKSLPLHGFPAPVPARNRGLA